MQDAPVKKRRTWSWLTAAALLLVGGIIGFMYGKFGAAGFHLTAKTEWDVPEILGALFTLIIALYVQHFVVVGSDAEKARRGYLIELAGAVRSSLDRLHADFRNRVTDIGIVTADLRALNAAVEEFRHALQLCASKCSSAPMELDLRLYRQTLAAFDFPTQSSVTAAEQAMLENTYAVIRKDISRIILELHSG